MLNLFFGKKNACRKLKIETVAVFVARETIARETTYGDNFIFL